MPLRFANTRTDRLAVDMTGVTPTSLAGKSLNDIRATSVFHGNRPTPLGELFTITGDAADLFWQFDGNASAVHSLGAEMTDGEIRVAGPIGRHAGERMRGGRIEINGNAGDFLGAEVAGGAIRVRGSAGDHVGAARVGSRRGMTGGTILIDGSAGQGVAARMRRGIIAIAGNAGESLGRDMLAGTILVFGAVGTHVGAGMRRGTIGLFGPVPTLLPTYRLACRGSLPMLALIKRELQAAAFAPPLLEKLTHPVELYHGDLLELGRGEILISAEILKA
jgi:formylmethanofuran dehydrogenase subunit C